MRHRYLKSTRSQQLVRVWVERPDRRDSEQRRRPSRVVSGSELEVADTLRRRLVLRCLAPYEVDVAAQLDGGGALQWLGHVRHHLRRVGSRIDLLNVVDRATGHSAVDRLAAEHVQLPGHRRYSRITHWHAQRRHRPIRAAIRRREHRRVRRAARVAPDDVRRLA